MGQAQSDINAALPDVGTASAIKARDPAAIKLYQYVTAHGQGEWKVVTNNARPSFYNANEDSGAGKPDWHLEIDGSDVDVRIDQELSFVIDLHQLRLTFCAMDSVWALKFNDEERYRRFNQELNDRAFTNMTGLDNDEESRAKELGQDFAGMFFTNNAEAAAQPMEDEEDDTQVQDTPSKMQEEQAYEDEDADPDNQIQGLLIGGLDNTYLMRGKRIDVLGNVQGGVQDKHVSFTLTPAKGTPARGLGAPLTPAFTPSKVLLANSERNMLLLTPQNETVIHKADIETETVVSTWNFQKDGVDIPIREIHHDNKAAQMEQSSTFMGLDANRLTRWDMRDPRGMVQQSPIVSYTGGKDFARGTNFTCMATSGDGYVAVGSKDGKVRLYSSKSLARASTSIPGLGSPITSIDVTYDGKWVVATTDKYLMLVKTTYTDAKGSESNAFIKSMGNKGTVPRLLRLKPEDAARTGGKPFAKGKFTWITESGVEEKWVVAQCGTFSVIWNFKRIKASGADSISYGGLPSCMDYVISAKDTDVVDAAFLHPRYAKHAGQDAGVVVATSSNVSYLGN